MALSSISSVGCASIVLARRQLGSDVGEYFSSLLTSLDTLITSATQEFETLKTHKKGLMQQLFPSAEAVEA